MVAVTKTRWAQLHHYLTQRGPLEAEVRFKVGARQRSLILNILRVEGHSEAEVWFTGGACQRSLLLNIHRVEGPLSGRIYSLQGEESTKSKTQSNTK